MERSFKGGLESIQLLPLITDPGKGLTSSEIEGVWLTMTVSNGYGMR